MAGGYDSGGFVERLDDRTAGALGRLGVVRRYRRGATLMLEGDHNDEVLLVTGGRVKIVMSADDGRELVLLVDLASADGNGGAEGPVKIGVPLSQEELASMVATSRETMGRALAALRRRGLVTTGRRSITVLDLRRMRSYAGG